MRSPSEIERLLAAAESWLGTPFCEGSAVKGAGVCCHRLPGEIYFEAGWLDRFVLPTGPTGWARTGTRPLMEPYLDAYEQLRSLTVDEAIEPGDLLGFRLGAWVHHLALAMPGGRMIHVAQNVGVRMEACIPAMWARRLARSWRIIS
jgi:cell wall-associated NlpC family hydrolase